MPTKGVLDRQRVGKVIVAAANTHAREVGERLNEDLAVILTEGETLADFTDLQLHLGRYLDMKLQALVAADETHLQELDDDLDPRLRRDEAAELLYQKLVEMRETVNAVFGSERAATLIGIDGDTPRDPLKLHRHATRILDRLRAPDATLPPQRLRGVQLDPVVLTDELQPATDLLGEALADVDRELRETETTLSLKTEAMEAFDRTVRGVGRILQGCDELADFPEFAEKIRLSRTARGSRSDPSPEQEEPGSPEDEVPSPGEPEEPETTDNPQPVPPEEAESSDSALS